MTSDDIRAAREMAAEMAVGARAVTHSGECHRWHPACALVRLCDALEWEWERRGEPAPGVWLVEEHDGGRSMHRFAKLGELPDPMPMAAIARQADAIMLAVSRVRGRTAIRRVRHGTEIVWHMSDADVADAIVRELARMAEGEEVSHG